MAKRSTPALGVADYSLATVDDLTNGVDLRHTPTLMQPGRARVLRNVSISEPGVWQPYPGHRSFSLSNLGAGRLQGAQRIYLSSGAPFTLAARSGSVYKPADDGTWGASVLAGLHASNDVFFPHDRNLVAAFDSSSVPKKSADGTTWTQDGITPPGAPGLSAVAGGSLVSGNSYEVSYSYQDDGLVFESNEGTVATVTPAGANLTIRVSVVASTDPQVDKINIYIRNVSAGESVRRRVVQLANATATYDITSATWTTGVDAPTTHTVPVAMSFGAVWKNRWWGRDATVKNRIRFTEIFLPQAWPALYYIDVPFERGDEVRGMIALGDTLVVFGDTKAYLIIGQTSLDFEVRPSAGVIAGAFGPRAVCVVEQGIVHAANGGAYLFDGASDSLLTQDITTAWQDFVARTSGADLARLPVVYHDTRKEVRIAVPRLHPLGTPGEWVLDLVRTRSQQNEPAWTSTTRDIGGYLPWDGPESSVGNRNRLFTWSTTDGILREEAVGTSADGADMDVEYEGPALVPAPRRVCRFIDLTIEYAPVAGSFGVEIRVDEAVVGSVTFTLGAAGAIYGTSVYGTATYASTVRQQVQVPLPLEAEGRSISLYARYQGQATFKWFTYAVGTVPEPQLRGL
jgi:hypothetical protein